MNSQDLVGPLLTTKLWIPRPGPALLPRTHLIQRLDTGLLTSRLTLLSAPAGFGKTTLLAQWANQPSRDPHDQLPVAWLSLDPEDDDPARFLAYLIAALQEAGLLPEDVPPGRVLESSSVDAMLPNVVNQLAQNPSLSLLVLDDYHYIGEHAVHDAVTFLLEHAPPPPRGLHVAISTRADPPLSIARLRARGQLMELRQEDLRLTPEETAAFLREGMGLELSPQAVGALDARTEGWVSGLQMAALSLRNQPDPEAQVRAFTGTNRFILDYLIEEVLQRQPSQLQHFLLHTSILERMCGPLCDALLTKTRFGEALESTGCQAILEHLERSNLFLVPLDDRREWYRYHRLFADLLQRRLQQVDPGALPVLHQRASAWFEAQGLPGPAIEHALAARNYERAADLLEQAADETLARSETVTFLRWVQALPDKTRRGRPSLLVFHAWALLLRGHPLDEVERLLRLAEPEGGARDEVSPQAAAAAAARSAVALWQGRFADAMTLAGQALAGLPQGQSFLRGLASWIMRLVQSLSRDHADMIPLLEDAASKSAETGNVVVATMARCQLAEVHMALGDLQQAREQYQQAVVQATTPGGELLPIAGMALIGLGEVAREQNELDSAGRHLLQGIELSASWSGVAAFDGYASLIRVRLSQGDQAAARQALAQMKEAAARFSIMDLDDFAADLLQARLWIAQGELDAAAQWLDAPGLDTYPMAAAMGDTDSFMRFQLYKHVRITAARLYLARKQPAEALAVLEPILAKTQELGGVRREAELQALRSLALQQMGELDLALKALERALDLGEPGGFVRSFVDEGPLMARLLQQAALRDIHPQYVGRLLAAFAEAIPPEGAAQSALPPSAVSETPERLPLELEPLSERELEVLQLIALGLTNQQIADRLVLSLPTIKWHAGNIYGKLGVSNRTQAVARATSLGILATPGA